ncbi:hypothetical protein TWF696_001445 [Orbilia brochopaga]|uniref:Actin binding protein n=1 Tax=Orbilia brochopaga TaxID=3140254 RepID=A0AAV9UCM8_9PEZI
MSALDLSQEGPAINRSVKSITTASVPSGKSPTHAHWVLLYVQAPLRNAFSQGPPKPSVLKVQATGEGELEELIEEFNDGRVQFALAKVKDPNTQLGKNIFFAWCGEGVPEHVKGSYGSYQSAVQKLFEGYHVQISARNSETLNVDDIMKKVATASGSAYSAATTPSSAGSSKPAAPPKPAWKPGMAYTPTRQYGTPAAPRGRPAAPKAEVDADGWGADAPQVSRTKLENVQSAYQPTKVNMKELMAQPSSTTSGGFEKPDVVRGAYQPVGKVDIAAIRAQGDKRFDTKPEVIKGAYQPVGKVDIAAIRAAAQPPREQPQQSEEGPSRSLADRSAAFNKPAPAPASGRLTTLPKPKPARSFGTPAVFGTKPNLPSEYGTGPAGIPAAAPVGSANKDFASQGGKTPAQIWQEKKNRERGLSGSAEPAAPAASSWRAAPAAEPEPSPPAPAPEPEEEEPQSGGVSALRDRFRGMPVPSMAGPPQPAMSTKPPPAPARYDEPEEEEEAPPQPAARFVPPPPAQVQPQRSPTPSPPRSPARIAMPVARGAAPSEPPAVPHASRPRSPSPEPAPITPAVGAAIGLAAVGAGAGLAAAAAAASSGVTLTGRRARIIYDYEKAEDNEIELVEGQIVGMIEMVDDDWWQGTNEAGETGLFPSNYVEPIEDDEEEEEAPPAARPPPAPPVAEPEPEMHHAAGGGQTATAVYDYEAAEENELAFPEGATITDIEFPDEDWWFGHYNGAQGLFPSNYVELNH